MTDSITELTPRLVVHDAAAAIDFYDRALGGVEQERFETDGVIAHVLVTIDGHPIALKDADDVDPDPMRLGGSPVLMTLTVADVDGVAARMVDAGAEVVFAIDDRDYGYRDGRLRDPFGHLWLLSQPLDR
jgi:PhnB protein